MEEAGEDCPIAKLLSHQDVVGDIMLKLGSSRSMISFSAVNKACLAAKKNPGLVARFAEVNKAAFVGFLVEFKQLGTKNTRRFRVIYHGQSREEESAVAIRRKINTDLVSKDTILSAVGGCVLTAGRGEEVEPTEYFISYPSDDPKAYTAVASNMPKIPEDGGQHTKNTYGQFGVMRSEGSSGISFFVKDWADSFVCTYEGARIRPKEKIYIHVCELLGGSWIRNVSPPYDPAICGLLHRNPYSVLLGDSLYLMYVLRFVVHLDFVSKKFSKIHLPDVVTDKVSSWFDYTICQHSKAGLALIHYCRGMLNTWLLNSVSGGWSWQLESTVHLFDIFVPRIPRDVVASLLSNENDPVRRGLYYTVQVRSASPEGRFVLLTLGFDPNMYIVDMVKKKVYQIGNGDGDGPIGRVYGLTEHWPPKM